MSELVGRTPERLVRIDVAKSSSHQLSQNEIGSDNPCYRHLFGNAQFPTNNIGPTWNSERLLHPCWSDQLELWHDEMITELMLQVD
jgi:hypothetical protein